ncbi:MAG: response regulator [Methylotenera sp.]|jgi:CheY-like chemotaxis protein|uniref:LytR/AlgR family response regulator transcription factor n=1 Tax=Methylotenera sp. TaxID=2051956 RepID=UPI00272816DE|nr:response regulator [Methylotenera sp.]MDO9392672.1 response regulator [Methylotenera sp.]MDP2230300.1 response regulator [Methylotenera sp.]MDP3308985.1 response regulator [Methylotenera sp.]
MIGFCVLIVDDEPLARRRLIRLVEKLDWISRVEQVSDFHQACYMLQKIKPDILLLDIQIPGGSGFDVLDDIEIIKLELAFYQLRYQSSLTASVITKI